MTSVADVINQALLIIDDVRFAEDMQTNPALFYRRMSAYVYTAMALLNRPPELYRYIYQGYTPPIAGDFAWTSDTNSITNETQVDTGLIGYDMCSVVIRSEDGMSTEPYAKATYDANTGIVTFPIQPAVGIQYDIDFYKDGYFNELTPPMMRLFGLAIAVIWYERFANNWLNMQPKLKDASFSTVNESNYIEKMTERMVQNRQAFSDELRKYEQDNAYNFVVPRVGRNNRLI